MSSLSDVALVFGCGYLGRRVAERWTAAGRRVVVLTRGRAAELAAAGFEPHVGDVTDPATLRGLPAASTVLYAVGMDRAAGKSMDAVYVGGLANVLDALPPPVRFIYVSSTSVYGQTDGSEVDERSPIEPVEPSGRVVLEAERLLRSRLPDAVVLRFAGLYGPGRLLREKALRAGEPLVGDADKWLNLVHVEDGAAAVLAAESSPRGSVFNVSDGHPVRRRDFYTHLAELLNAPAAAFEPGEPGPAEANRRVVSRGGLPGWRPAFPDYRSGLAASRPPSAATPPAPVTRPAG